MAKYMVKAESPRARFSTMSGGNQQKVVLARWLRREPRVLLLDEPTQGVDVGARLEIWDLVREGAARGAAVVTVCSDFDELARACDRAVVLQRGAAVGECEGADLDGATLEHSVLWKGAV
jgi:ribose transport system ATP-binding protein